jgi:uncharacterized lipoprotein YddW (UPF0748 family)
MRFRHFLLALMACLVCLGIFCLCLLPGNTPGASVQDDGASATRAPDNPAAPGASSKAVASASPLPAASPSACSSAGTACLSRRAVWISYLEWQELDFSSEEAFDAGIAPMLDACADLGLNTVLAQVRPFADALYPSKLFPFSHLCTGTQGQDPGFDPLARLAAAAHARGLRLEAWVNPYRVSQGSVPAVLAGSNLCFTHPDWIKTTDSGRYLDPALPAVRQYIADGLTELCQNYALDGIQFDDYFYPTTDAGFDAEEYAAYCAAIPDGETPLGLADWRRENVSALVRLCYAAVHQFAGVEFGISPQGNLDSCRNAQYSDAAAWLDTAGYVDYLMPQIYWGLDYQKDGSTAMSFGSCVQRWLALPRGSGAALYFGLGAYRIGDGDGGDAPGEWQCGGALAAQVRWLAQQSVQGFALYRYDSLFANLSWPRASALRCVPCWRI